MRPRFVATTAQQPAQWEMLPTTPSGQRGTRSASLSSANPSIPSCANARRARLRPSVNSRRRLTPARSMQAASSGCRRAGSLAALPVTAAVITGSGKSVRIACPTSLIAPWLTESPDCADPMVAAGLGAGEPGAGLLVYIRLSRGVPGSARTASRARESAGPSEPATRSHPPRRIAGCRRSRS